MYRCYCLKQSINFQQSELNGVATLIRGKVQFPRSNQIAIFLEQQ